MIENNQRNSINNSAYKPAVFHWFYRGIATNKHIWYPFSYKDSALIEENFENSVFGDTPILVPVEGGRYDVNIPARIMIPVYWKGNSIEVRRCSWFHKNTSTKFVPYDEEIARTLEAEYKDALETGVWNRKVSISKREHVELYGPTSLVQVQPYRNPDAWGAGSTHGPHHPRVVKRDIEDFNIEEGESERVDQLIFMVHGIGAGCDLKFRSVQEVVNSFRIIAQQLLQNHYKCASENGEIGRVEVLPISWHENLHSDELGIDDKLKSITLKSIPRLRTFTNETLLDILFYTSPTYCQQITNTVASSMNEIYRKYCQRHPAFNGNVSLAGHSLGSVILFDLLCHQSNPYDYMAGNNDKHFFSSTTESRMKNVQTTPSVPLPASEPIYTSGSAGTGQPYVNYMQLAFQPKKFFALGSPIGIFITVRGIDKLGVDFRLPSCSGFYNIFHPFDPVAYRVEALVNPGLTTVRPVQIPHHKGRKRMHLEIKDTMARVSAKLKARFIDTFKYTLDGVNFLTSKIRRNSEEDEESKENSQGSQLQLSGSSVDEIGPTTSSAIRTRKLLKIQDEDGDSITLSSDSQQSGDVSHSTLTSEITLEESANQSLGKLNDAKRIDYVLQEAPLEFINEYIFALSSHVCYWESEDTILFILKEIYTDMNVLTDTQVAHQAAAAAAAAAATAAAETATINVSI